MTSLKFFLNLPLNFNDICFIYPPKVKEIVGNDEFFIYLNLLTKSQEELEDLWQENKLDVAETPTPLQYILSVAQASTENFQLVERAFFFFTQQPVYFLYEYNAILVGEIADELNEISSLEELRLLTEENFFSFQNMIRETMGEKAIEPPDSSEDPRIKRMKAKARYRDKIKAKKGMGISLSASLIAICCMNMSINPLNIGELSYAAVQKLIEMYQQKESYDLDIRSLLAGADSKKVKPKYWIRNFD